MTSKENSSRTILNTEALPAISNAPNASLGTFKVLDIESTTILIKVVSTKSYKLAPIPTTLLKENLKETAPTICKITNQSLQFVRILSILKLPCKTFTLKNTLNQLSRTKDQFQTSHSY